MAGSGSTGNSSEPELSKVGMCAQVERYRPGPNKPSDACARRDVGRPILREVLTARLRISVSSGGAITGQRMEEEYCADSAMGR
jgi:hypothetical protein